MPRYIEHLSTVALRRDKTGDSLERVADMKRDARGQYEVGA